MTTDLNFLFVTRTFSEDYRVYGAKGKETFSELMEFTPLRQKSRFTEDDSGVVIFENRGGIFLFASGLKRDAKDASNRKIRFSFRMILGDKKQAIAAFAKMVAEWNVAEEQIHSLLKDKKVPGSELQASAVYFDEDKFMDWLLEGVSLKSKQQG